MLQFFPEFWIIEKHLIDAEFLSAILTIVYLISRFYNFILEF